MSHATADVRHIYEGWHAAVVARDVDALMALYADDAVLETPLIVVTLPDHGSGVLHGKAAIGAFFAAGLRNPGNKLGRWYRTGLFFSDLRDGLIAHHRVYWGWVGFLALRAATPAPERA
ncbi:nuclear transport factor 2 family protein [Burkholderia sp. AU45274]|uniref:nuclear transport factor 2 family protein n=1 Tax=Burkholderia sp. AU45274 TaxID=3059205 RepID=UPI00264CDA2A|nr:nuclear transport factor 2 family protein [Burkholderia sp. AU45274]MDN7491050.1 nuclear transport factor 2 family protein [Burkholderia sp. AU45274]